MTIISDGAACDSSLLQGTVFSEKLIWHSTCQEIPCYKSWKFCNAFRNWTLTSSLPFTL
jgi:hypothetical protein